MGQNGKRPTLREIAARVGVSETAASFALNGRPGISEATRKKVLDVVEEMGWRPSYAARVLSGARSRTIGLVLTQNTATVDSELFFIRLMTGMQTVLSRSQCGLLMQVVQTVEEEIEVYRTWHAEGRVDGVVLVDLRADDPRPRAMVDLGLPAVLAGGPDPEGLLPSVSIDDAAAMTLVLQHLRELGHRHVAYVSGPRDLLHVRRRLDAFDAVVAEQLDGGHVISTDFTSEAAAAATRELLAHAPAPTAVVCDNEIVAVSLMLTLRSLGRHVPEDLAVVSWEDTPVCQAMHPPLTALHRNTHEFGADVAEQLLKILAGEPPESSQEQTPQLIVRASTDSARA
ncbi:LacI family DNA-binding transcriptional regulator [Bogoriella caseilytica]|uniref:LacI family transcriptional regulator n=1 Tax=Bogoriella caseilytica TaxID=56055 RepID=A0A3N2BDC2_9MICO|nr:LacI family DNA-binding transcriptional regulator [Bogoriella caseilytica]ROR73044.1 LacI family transcriptional regulator [Bogoriella caseilytica]